MAKDAMTKQIEKTTSDKFVEALDGMDWAETKDIVSRLDSIPGFWKNAAALEKILESWKMTFVRRQIKQIKREGVSLFASVETVDKDGNTVRVYKREDSFAPDDYKTTAAYHDSFGRYHLKMAIHYANGFERITGKKMILSFEPDCFTD